MHKRTILPSGIRVLSQEMTHVRSVSLGIWVSVGAAIEPDGLGGVTHLLEHMKFKGTRSRNTAAIAADFEAIGCQVDAFTGREYMGYTLNVLARYFERSVNLLTDLFFNSVYDPVELEREKKVVLEEINMYEDTPDDLVCDLFVQHLWPDSALGRPVLGTKHSLGGLNRQLLADYEARVVSVGQVVVSAAGAVGHDRLLKSLGAEYGLSLAKADPDPVRATAATRPFFLLSRPLEQVHFCLGGSALAHSDPRRYALYILNYLLGGGMSSRLNQQIRERHGLAYSIHSFTSYFSYGGLFAVYAAVAPGEFLRTVELVVTELLGLCQAGITEKELNIAKVMLSSRTVISLEDNEGIMAKLARNEHLYERQIPLDNILGKIEAVTVEAVQELACELLTGDNWPGIVAVGTMPANCQYLLEEQLARLK